MLRAGKGGWEAAYKSAKRAFSLLLLLPRLLPLAGIRQLIARL
jgi:hypothetical protein